MVQLFDVNSSKCYSLDRKLRNVKWNYKYYFRSKLLQIKNQCVGNEAQRWISNGGNKKTKYSRFSEKWTFHIPWYASTDSSKCPMEITKLIRKLKSVNLLLFYMTETETKTLNMKRETNNEIITTRF